MLNIMITGATGLLGRTLYSTLRHHHQVIGTGFNRAKAPIHTLDLSNTDDVCDFLDKHNFDVLIHAAAERRPDVCDTDPQATIALNVQATEFLAKQCKIRNIKLIFISTDYVFDGHDAPYRESDMTNPVNLYGETKAHAEQAIFAVCTHHTVLRVPVLYGEVEYLAESAVTVLANTISKTQPSDHDDWAIRFPTHVEDIAFTLRDLLIQLQHCHGMFHISDDQAMTKYQMAQIMANALQCPSHLLNAQAKPTQTATRPYNCELQDTRLRVLGINHKRSFRHAIVDILKKAV